MGATKSDFFTKEQNELAELLKAMAHPARIAILQRLVKVNACVCGDLVEELPLAQATVSQHLKELKNAGLIHGVVEGKSVCYCIEPGRWNQVAEILKELFGSYSNKTKCC